MRSIYIFLSIYILTLTMQGCSNEQHDTEHTGPNLLIYCGVTMVYPIREIGDLFEKQHNCTFSIIQGGSEDLYQNLKNSKKGDLYFPGLDSYRHKYFDEGMLRDSVFVGYNLASLVVAKGNPKQIPSDIHALANNQFNVAIGNPDVCSIGYFTRSLLTEIGIYEQVVSNSVLLTSDSNSMAQLLKVGSVDLIMNWHPTVFFENNIEFMEILPMDKSLFPQEKLFINLLTYSRNPALARSFMEFAASETGQAIFRKYHFLHDPDTTLSAQH